MNGRAGGGLLILKSLEVLVHKLHGMIRVFKRGEPFIPDYSFIKIALQLHIGMEIPSRETSGIESVKMDLSGLQESISTYSEFPP